jgi:hypothetical protein
MNKKYYQLKLPHRDPIDIGLSHDEKFIEYASKYNERLIDLYINPPIVECKRSELKDRRRVNKPIGWVYTIGVLLGFERKNKFKNRRVNIHSDRRIR